MLDQICLGPWILWVSTPVFWLSNLDHLSVPLSRQDTLRSSETATRHLEIWQRFWDCCTVLLHVPAVCQTKKLWTSLPRVHGPTHQSCLVPGPTVTCDSKWVLFLLHNRSQDYSIACLTYLVLKTEIAKTRPTFSALRIWLWQSYALKTNKPRFTRMNVGLGIIFFHHRFIKNTKIKNKMKSSKDHEIEI